MLLQEVSLGSLDMTMLQHLQCCLLPCRCPLPDGRYHDRASPTQSTQTRCQNRSSSCGLPRQKYGWLDSVPLLQERSASAGEGGSIHCFNGVGMHGNSTTTKTSVSPPMQISGGAGCGEFGFQLHLRCWVFSVWRGYICLAGSSTC